MAAMTWNNRPTQTVQITSKKSQQILDWFSYKSAPEAADQGK
jgi:hypothetical protein